MTERPIIFSAPMVRAILAGTKTQTRRIVKPQPIVERPTSQQVEGWARGVGIRAYCWPGDTLWVRETWTRRADFHLSGMYAYRAGPSPLDVKSDLVGWKPSIHMPRAAARILLRVTGVRVERLQEISGADARAEGWNGAADPVAHPKDWFHDFWDSINAKRRDHQGRWDAAWHSNPWVWVIEFEKTT